MLRLQLESIVESQLSRIFQVYGHSEVQVQFSVEKPKNPDHGDFSVDLAFQLAKPFRKSPFEIAETFVNIIREQKERNENINAIITDVQAVRPGFINFTLSTAAVFNSLHTILKEDTAYGNSRSGKNQKVILEYVSANPTGPLTIAHGRQAALGDTLANIMRAAGYDVFREYYLNDGGRQISLLAESTWARYKELLGDKISFPEEGYQGEYIRDIAQRIVNEKKDEFRNKTYQEVKGYFASYATEVLMAEIKIDLAAINVDFDAYFSEQTLKGEAIDLVLALLEEKKLLFEQENALWFRSTDFGDDKDRVLKKSTGEFTYLVPDIAYHRNKFERGFKRVIDFLGPDHHGYIKRLKASVAALGYDPQQLEVLIVQLTTLYKNGEPFRMSTRAGNFISLRQLIDEVGSDATRFFFLMRKVNSHLDFDLDLAKEKSQDNPVFYLQYAHARIVSIINYADRVVDKQGDLSPLQETDEISLIRLINDFPYQIAQTARSLEPYRLADYLKDVAAEFHRFYAHHRVVSDDAVLTNARLILCEAVRIVLRNGLTILGVSHPDQM